MSGLKYYDPKRDQPSAATVLELYQQISDMRSEEIKQNPSKSPAEVQAELIHLEKLDKAIAREVDIRQRLAHFMEYCRQQPLELDLSARVYHGRELIEDDREVLRAASIPANDDYNANHTVNWILEEAANLGLETRAQRDSVSFEI